MSFQVYCYVFKVSKAKLGWQKEWNKERHTVRTLELVEGSQSWLLILLAVIYEILGITQSRAVEMLA